MELKTLLRPIKRIMSAISEFRITHQRRVFLSFGENCLTDDILKRYNIKSFSTPYSSGRSNIEYILQIEKDRYNDFLNPDYLEYGYADDHQVVRLKKYMHVRNVYNCAHMQGFEFTHHNVLGETSAREKMKRRASRMLKLRNNEINIFYHSRSTPETDENMLLTHLAELKSIYESRCKTVNVYMFTQIIVDDDSLRRVECQMKRGIHVYNFYVLNEWAGTDQDIFWAKCDDDLIETMIRDAIRGKYSHQTMTFGVER